MKERPILFSGEMVLALLEGRKTQTRRQVKLPMWAQECNEDHEFEMDGDPDWPHAISRKTGCLSAIECPYGVPGDRLWMRETHAIVPQSAYWHDPTIQHREHDHQWAIYREGWERSAPTWKPSIHMPRWASRITLEITGVRVERLQDIGEEDAFAEGIRGGDWLGDPVGEYAALWDKINGPGTWDKNTWTWVIEFKPCAASSGRQP